MIGRMQFHKLRNFATYEILLVCKNFATLQNSYGAPISLYFLFFFPSGLCSAMMSLTRILRAWIDSTIFAEIACKNCKICHKIRLVA